MEYALEILEKNLHANVINVGETSLRASLARLEKDDLKQVGLLLLISEASNPLKKILSIFYIYLRIIFLKQYLKYKKCSPLALYGVYPTVTEPVAIYQLNSAAASYMHKHVLPAFPSGANGSLRNGILTVTKLHPSLAGVVLMVQGAE